jgi:glutamine synthetase
MIWEQHEIELALAPLPEAADAIVLTQWVLRNLAHGDGLRCSFDPIVRQGHAGSGLHVHFSPVRDGEHLAGLRDGVGYGDEARWIIGGLVRLGGALMAFGNRDPGSLIRLGQGKEAPTHLTWGRYNRDALVRLPAQVIAGDGRVVSPETIEFRLPDGSAHPHLLLAGCAQALLEGRRMKDLDAFLVRTEATYASQRPDAATPVPRGFGEVAAELERCRAVLEAGGVFPPGQITTTLERLRTES